MRLQEKLGIRIRELRKERKITQAVLAEMTDLSDNFIGLLERGKATPSLDTIEKLAEVLKAPVRELFSFEEDRVSKKVVLSELSRELREKSEEDVIWFRNVSSLLLKKMRD